jgi:hypothetical protein
MAGISGVAQFLRNIIATEENQETTPVKGRVGSTATTSAKNPPLDVFEVLKGAAAMAAMGGVGLLTGCGPTADSGTACEESDQIRFVPAVTAATSTADRPITFCLGTDDAWDKCDDYHDRDDAIACSKLSNDLDCLVLQPGECGELSVQPDENGLLVTYVWRLEDEWRMVHADREEFPTRTHCRGESIADVPQDSCDESQSQNSTRYNNDDWVELECGEP